VEGMNKCTGVGEDDSQERLPRDHPDRFLRDGRQNRVRSHCSLEVLPREMASMHMESHPITLHITQCLACPEHSSSVGNTSENTGGNRLERRCSQGVLTCRQTAMSDDHRIHQSAKSVQCAATTVLCLASNWQHCMRDSFPRMGDHGNQW